MGEYYLNLSTKPFPAYRVASCIMLVIFLVLVAVSAGQVMGYGDYTKRANEIKPQERDLIAKTAVLTKQEEALQKQLGGSLATAKISEVNYINMLIERRNFCWTCLLRHIETRIPVNVHLTSLKPDLLGDGTVVLSISAQGRSLNDLANFIDSLQGQSPKVFEKVNVAVEEIHPDFSSMVMTVPYFPCRDGLADEAAAKKTDCRSATAVVPAVPAGKKGD